jgi:translation elongation factor EF-G
MKKRVSNEQVAQFIAQCATDVEFEWLFEFGSAQSAMVRAENRFIESLTHEQKELYEKYLQEKQNYIDVVAQRYQKLK